jgi:hypothetical protein
MFEIGEDREHHSGDTGFTAAEPVADATVSSNAPIQEQGTRFLSQPIRWRQTEVALVWSWARAGRLRRGE